MNYIKYFQQNDYELNKSDCWTFVQEVFFDEHGINLPDHPIMTDKSQAASCLRSNIPYEVVRKAQKGCIVYYHNGQTHHAGYAINDQKYIHKTHKRVEVSNIPEKAIIYKIL